MKPYSSESMRVLQLLSILGSVLFAPPLMAVNCFPGNITLSTQANVDNFQSTYGPCDSISGILSIKGGDITNVDALSDLVSIFELRIEYNPELSDLDGFSSLTHVGNDLKIIQSNKLSSLDGLSKLAEIGGTLWIMGGYDSPPEKGNDLLFDIDGLTSLTSVYGLEIRNNNVLGNIDGLGNLEMADSVYLAGNPALVNINGLANLHSISQGLGIWGNGLLADINGLANVTGAVDSSVQIADTQIQDLEALSGMSGTSNTLLWVAKNPNLESVSGLAGFTNVGYLGIANNPQLTNVDALQNLENASQGVYIGNNASLTSLQGLDNLRHVGTQGLQLRGNSNLAALNSLSKINGIDGDLTLGRDPSTSNPLLGDCSSLALVLGWPAAPPDDLVNGAIHISNNNVGCNSVEEILASVSGPTAPSITESEATSGQAMLTFLPATTADSFWTITGYRAHCLSDNQYVFQNNTTTAIPDNSSVDSSVSISGVPFKNSAGLRISVNITHPRTRHLTLILTSPTGTSVKLWDEAVGAGSDLIGTFPTTLEPAESLDAFDGLNFNGDWHLTVADGVASFTGTLNSWGITARGEVTATSETSPVTLVGLADSQAHSCTVSAITGLGLGPASNIVSVTPTPELIFNNGFEE